MPGTAFRAALHRSRDEQIRDIGDGDDKNDHRHAHQPERRLCFGGHSVGRDDAVDRAQHRRSECIARGVAGATLGILKNLRGLEGRDTTLLKAARGRSREPSHASFEYRPPNFTDANAPIGTHVDVRLSIVLENPDGATPITEATAFHSEGSPNRVDRRPKRRRKFRL